MHSLRRDDEGAVAIVVALFAVVLFGFAALVVYVGNASDVRAQASTAADAGALAGERALASTASTPRAASRPTTLPSSAASCPRAASGPSTMPATATTMMSSGASDSSV